MVLVEEWTHSKSPKLICNSSLSSERYREGCYILRTLAGIKWEMHTVHSGVTFCKTIIYIYFI